MAEGCGALLAGANDVHESAAVFGIGGEAADGGALRVERDQQQGEEEPSRYRGHPNAYLNYIISPSSSKIIGGITATNNTHKYTTPPHSLLLNTAPQ